MATVKRFEDLECWQEARKLVNLIYSLTRKSEIKEAKEQSELVWKKINNFITYLNNYTN